MTATVRPTQGSENDSTAGTDDAFWQQVEPLRGELMAHCYRMLGSAGDAEDLVQETYLRAWRAYHGFEHRSSLRTWMYQIATNTCLTALQKREKRPLPTGLGQPRSDPHGELDSRPEISWLEPLPDRLVWGRTGSDPAAEAVTRESVRLAFVAALQHLTAQQRAVVILRDVLAWRAAETAETLGISVAAANSALQRARAHLAKLDPPDDGPADAGDGTGVSSASSTTELTDERQRELLESYAAAFENYDVARIVELLKADAVWEMPPFTGWYQGAAQIGELITDKCPAERAGDQRMIPLRANGQPAFALYMRDPADGQHKAFQIQQLTITDGQVAHVACYFDLSLFARFGLPEICPDGPIGR